jgi:hypothetical protein
MTLSPLSPTIQALLLLRPGAQWVIDGDDLATLQWHDTAQTRPTDAEIIAKAGNLPSPPAQILSQDMMAQFTIDDITKIKAAVDASMPFYLLWTSLQAQKDPMQITNARFLTGWSALVSVLGQARMNEIATALGATSLVV